MIYDVIVRMLAESLALGNAVMSRWVTTPANAAGPLDGNITLSSTGTDLAGYLASSAIHFIGVICSVFEALF